VNKGNAAAYRIKHATVPWRVDAGILKWRDVQTAEAFAYTLRTVSNLRQRFCGGLEAALERKR